jgi:uncharacterized protein
MLERQKILGRGWAFPPTFSGRNNNSGVVMVEGKEDIDQSLEILLNTSLGERVMAPDYGCNLKDYQFEPMNTSLVGRLRDLIANAILYHEPRIQLEKLGISEADALTGKLLIEVEYTVRTTNSRYNYVYDFYLKEASF